MRGWLFETLVVVIILEVVWLVYLIEPYVGLR